MLWFAIGRGTPAIRHGWHASSWKFATIASRLTHVPILMITSEDGFAAEADAFARAIAEAGGKAPRKIHMETDHAYSDYRIALQTAVVSWLAAQRGRR